MRGGGGTVAGTHRRWGAAMRWRRVARGSCACARCRCGRRQHGRLALRRRAELTRRAGLVALGGSCHGAASVASRLHHHHHQHHQHHHRHHHREGSGAPACARVRWGGNAVLVVRGASEGAIPPRARRLGRPSLGCCTPHSPTAVLPRVRAQSARPFQAHLVGAPRLSLARRPARLAAAPPLVAAHRGHLFLAVFPPPLALWRHGSARRGAGVAPAQAACARCGARIAARRRGISIARRASFRPTPRGGGHAPGSPRRGQWRPGCAARGQARRHGEAY
jgi:hypothetical protein